MFAQMVRLRVFRFTVLWALLGSAVMICQAEDGKAAALADKTLVVWASPANLSQRGGSALTVNDTTIDRFDAIVFAEITPRVWMPGSNGFSRTTKAQADWPKETATAEEFVQIAIVYRGKEIRVYRNGQVYAKYRTGGEPYVFRSQTAILIGPRHLTKGVDCFFGRIRDRRIWQG